MGTGMLVFHSGSGISTPQPQAQVRSTPMHNDRGELDQPGALTAHEYLCVLLLLLGGLANNDVYMCLSAVDMLQAQAQTRASLVPIRVEFETDTLRIRDCFIWNLNETLIKPDAIEWGVIGGDKEAEGMKDKTGLGMGWGRTKGPKVLQSVWREWTEAEEFRTRFKVLFLYGWVYRYVVTL
jgi:hypothetical protein